MAVTGQESTHDLKLMLTKRLYSAVVLNSSILKVKDVLKIQEIERIVNILKKRSHWNGVRTFLQLYPCFFLIADENGTAVIKPIVTIEFCRDFDGKKGCPKNFCSKLHVCRHFVKGKCTFGPRCKKPHHFQNNETREVLKKHFLDALGDEETREFLCRNVQHLLDPDAANSDLPKSLEICKYYNVATGCTREFCPYIHVCRFYAEEGNCKFGSQCIRKHDINNVHSRILLHRYHMEHLSEQQVMAYLKIKGENRDQQQQQQQTMKLEKSSPPLLNSSSKNVNLPSTLPTQFALPNTILGNIHDLVADGVPRKLSQPTPMKNIHILEDASHTRKLSLPTPPINSSAMYRPPVTYEENSIHGHMSTTTSQAMLGSNLHQNNTDTQTHSSRLANSFKANSFSSIIDEQDYSSQKAERNNVNNDYKHLNRFCSENNLTANNAYNRKLGIHGSKSFNDSFIQYITNNFHQNFNFKDTRKLSSNYSKSFTYDGLGLHNLSPPTTISGNFNITQPTSKNESKQSTTNILFSKSKSYETFQTKHIDINNTRDGGSNSFQSNYLPFSNSSHSEADSFFTSQIPFLRASSNDTISPTGSTSSFNGITNGQPSTFDSSEWSDNERLLKACISGDDEEFDLSYYRTRSLPIFNSQIVENSDKRSCGTGTPYLQNRSRSLKSGSGNCSCQKNQICEYYLKGNCRYPICKKLHTEDPFQWQISSTPTTSLNGHKNENFDKTTKPRWIDIDKNENLKLELAFCAVDLEHTEIDFCGENIMINFDEMIGIAKSDMMNSPNQGIASRSCDLSAWLLQANDETPSRRNSHEAVIYNVRRLSTPSSVSEDAHSKFCTKWLWFWQDSFGMWRNYPGNKSEVIEAHRACLSDEIELKFNEGRDQFLFEEQKVLCDFKAMIQINGRSRKQKRIRRRPNFFSEDQRGLISFELTTKQTCDIRRPWYWSQEQAFRDREYELVDVFENSEIYNTVRNHFGRSMLGNNFEILSMKSIQNFQLWTNFIRLRSQLKLSDIKVAEKFVFKSITEQHLAGVCQQGFQICTCKKGNDGTAQYNYFTTEAGKALSDFKKTNSNEGGINYMFCVRMSIPVTGDLNENGTEEVYSQDIPDCSENTVPASLSANKDSFMVCHHGYQVYPEFLIVFKV